MLPKTEPMRHAYSGGYGPVTGLTMNMRYGNCTYVYLEAGLLPDGARIVLVGSSVANNDTPAFMGMTVYDFGTGVPTDFGYGLHEAMRAFVARFRLDHLRG